jgi:putative copper resistance protein D
LSLLAPSLVILSTAVATSHAAGRVEGRAVLLALGALHMLAIASWIGALPYLVLSLARVQDRHLGQWLCRRFSNLAALSVAFVAGSGLALSGVYIDSAGALYGTAYGAMVSAKAILFALLLILGGLNFLTVRRMATAAEELIRKLQRVVEVEVGIGFTVVLAAASLSSQPPAVDLAADRIALSTIVQRMNPRWPSFDTPPVGSLSPATPLGFDNGGPQSPQSFVPGTSYQPNTPNDIAWSEYNHHWAGIIVFVAGILAVAARVPGLGFARNWPLAFLGLAVFLFLRADPENWPLGPRSFWQSFAVAEVLQHRVFVLLIILFAIFEWGVATGRISSPRAALVFPAVCAAGGALLLTHAHPLGNIKEELLSELSHLLLALFAVIAGWSRWLELRVEGQSRQVLSWIWAVCFVFIGAILLNYRES